MPPVSSDPTPLRPRALPPGALSARVLVDGLNQGWWTSHDLTETFLARIASRASLHAVCTVEAARAREQAKAADNRRVSGQSRGTLDGLPITLKDAMRVADSRSTYGLWPYRNHIPQTSSAAAAALETKGVVVLGRTTVPTGSFDWNGKNQVFPECTHPQDPAFSPGGSSAGAAVAVAAGLSPLDIGSDLGGSIRVPCHFCGVAGLRTTDGWIPVSDMAPEGLPLGYEHLVTLGPIAKDVADLMLVLDCWAEAFPAPERGLGEGPLAVSWAFGGSTVQPRTRKLMEEWLATQSAVEATPDLAVDTLWADWGTISGYEFARGMPWYGRNPLSRWFYAQAAIRPRLGPGTFTEVFCAGMQASPQEYANAMSRRDHAHVTMTEFFRHYRAWVLPVCPGPALRRDQSGGTIDGIPYTQWIGTTNAPTALLGTPALTLPLTTAHPTAGSRPADPSDLPIGIQIHGPRFSDRALVRAFSE